MSVSYPQKTVQLSGNTAGATAYLSTGTVILAGGNNITLSQAGNSVTISGANIPAGNTGSISAGTTSAALGQVVFSNSNNVTFGMDGGTVTATASFNQTAQTQSNVQGVSAGTQVGRTGDIVFSNSNGISFGMSNSSVVTASYTVPNVPAQTNQSLAVYALGNTTGQSSSSTYDARTLSVEGAGIVSVGWSNSSLRVSATQSNQAFSAAGGSSTFQTLSFNNANGATFSNNGGAVELSYTVPTVTNSAWTVSDNATSLTIARLAFTNANGLTLTLSTTTGGSATLVGSYTVPNVPAQTNQTLGIYGSSQTTGQSSSSTYDARSLTFRGAGAVSIGNSGGEIIVSAPNTIAQTNQSIGLYASSNTTGQSSSTTMDARTLSVRGAGIVSVGYSAGELIVSASAAGAADGVNIIAAGTQTANTTGTVVFSNSNGISFGMSNSSVVTASYAVPTQSNQSLAIYAVGNTTGQSSSSTYDARTLSVDGGGIVSAGWSNSTLRISATQSNQAFSAAGGSSTFQTLSFANANGATFSNNGGAVELSYTVPSVPAQTNQTIGIYGSSQTTGQSSSSTYDARSLTFRGAGAVSIGNSGGEVIVSAPNTIAQTNQSLAIYAVGNTTGQSSSSTYDARTLSVDGGGIVSAGWSNSTLRVSATQSNQALSGSNGSFTFQTATFGNLNGLSFYSSNGSMVGSYTVPTVTNSAMTVSDAATSGTLARLAFTNLNGVTLSLSTGANGSHTIVGSHNALTVQSVESHSIGISNLGNTSGTSGIASGGQVRYLLAGGNNITLSQSLNGASGTVTISAANQTVESNTFGMSNLGNTAGTSGVISGGQVQMLIVGSDNLTISQSINGSSATLSLFGPSPAAAAITLGMSNLGNSSGTSGTVNQQLYLAGGNNITLSQSINGAAATITVSGKNQTTQPMTFHLDGNVVGDATVTGNIVSLFADGAIALAGDSNASQIAIAATGFQAGISTHGNTAGTTGFATERLLLVGGNNITLSQSTNGANYATLTIVGGGGGGIANAAGTQTATSGTVVFSNSNGVSFGMSNSSVVTASVENNWTANWYYWPPGQGSSSGAGVGFGTMTVYPMVIPHHLSATRAHIYCSVTLQTSTSGTRIGTITARIGLYTRNGDTLSSVSTASQSFSWSHTSNGSTATYNGVKGFSVPLNVNATPGNYWYAVLINTSNGTGTVAMTNIVGAMNVSYAGPWGNVVNNSSNRFMPMGGYYTTSTNALPNTIGKSQISAGAFAAYKIPVVQFDNMDF